MTNFSCIDCKANTSKIDEYYMVWDEVWLSAKDNKEGMLCIGCLEKRLGRRLTPNDFTWAPVNDPSFMRASPRLKSRILGTKEE